MYALSKLYSMKRYGSISYIFPPINIPRNLDSERESNCPYLTNLSFVFPRSLALFSFTLTRFYEK